MKIKTNFAGLGGFFLLWAGQSISSLGTSMTSYALILWSYQRLGTVSSIAFLSAFTYLPSILFCFMAGALADRWDKKKIMVIGDCVAALGTVCILVLFTTGQLRTWHLYIVNFLLSCMNAFQSPAARVVITLLTPKEHYARTNGMFALSGSITRILTPAFATALFIFGGLQLVLIVDLITFALAVSSLIFWVKVPDVPSESPEERASFYKSCLQGVQYLGRHKPLLRMILFFAAINLLANTGIFGLSTPYVLARSGDDQGVLGLFQSAIGIGTALGSVAVSLSKPAKSRSVAMMIACLAAGLLFDIPLALGRSPVIWIAAALLGSISMPFVNANISVVMQTKVPIGMQGRVFSAQTTLMCWTIPIGLFLGGALADHLAEPFMLGSFGTPPALLSGLLGSGRGSGMALIILITILLSQAITLVELKNPIYRKLDQDDPFL